MNNIYQPIPMRIERIIQETDDASLRSFELSFKNKGDESTFFKAYNPGQFCQLSIFGKGEAPFGIASAAWEGSFIRFTVQNVGSFTDTIHHAKAGDRIGIRGPLGEWVSDLGLERERPGRHWRRVCFLNSVCPYKAHHACG